MEGGSAVPVPRRRGPNKGVPWRRDPDGPVSVIRLPLDVSDPVQRHRVERLFSGAYSLERALVRQGRSRLVAYRRARRLRDRVGAAKAREQFGVTRDAMERAAYAHLDRAPHLGPTKAVGMHLADRVWESMAAHLFVDVDGNRRGMPRTGSWWEFRSVPGRARSHTRERKWETFRLHGTLAGHEARFTTDGQFLQPVRMPQVVCDGRSWWDHHGPLVVVCTGLGSGDLVLPVKVPQAPSRRTFVEHHLSDPDSWHRITLVRDPDAHAAGGWRYEAHLMCLVDPYEAASTHGLRDQAANLTGAGRRAGVDVNVSNITVASVTPPEPPAESAGTKHRAPRPDVKVTVVRNSDKEKRRARKRRQAERRRRRAMDRARRAANPDQYELSKGQQARADRRAARGLDPVAVEVPKGPRKADAVGRPRQAYRRDRTSAAYRRARGQDRQTGAARTRTRRQAARAVARQLVAAHGTDVCVEQGQITAWAKNWPHAVAAFTPGMLVAALDAEIAAVRRTRGTVGGTGGGMRRAATGPTAMSQHCPCGTRVSKALADRTHRCPACGLHADRDVVSALLCAHVVHGDVTVPSTARVDYTATRQLVAQLGADVFAGLLARIDLFELDVAAHTALVQSQRRGSRTSGAADQGLQEAPPSEVHPRAGDQVPERDRTRAHRPARRSSVTVPAPTPDETATLLAGHAGTGGRRNGLTRPPAPDRAEKRVSS